MSRQDDQIALLNSLIRIKLSPSEIHGVGVFAMRDIQKGARLYAEMTPRLFKIPYGSFKKLFPDVRQLILERWPQVMNGSAFAYPTERIQAFMNHSTEPNYDAINDIMLEDVKGGEEITEDYALIPNSDKIFPWLKKDRSGII